MVRSDADGTECARTRWTASGALSLTGDPEGTCLVPPPGVMDRIEALGQAVGVDALAMLTERAALAGLRRGGQVICGGACRLLPTRDGEWLAVTLARPDDVALVPAWLRLDHIPEQPWETITHVSSSQPPDVLVQEARALGLPVARVGEVVEPTRSVSTEQIGTAAPLGRPPLVVDLSSLWAGPLCAHVLGRHGARVVKVESRTRPDGARAGPADFFDWLHGGHDSVVLDLTEPDGRQRLRQLLLAADVVIEASRPRALQQLGIVAHEIVRDGPRVWISITGYGRQAAPLAVAFGDDAAAAGGLVAWGEDGVPRFAVDAIADPLSGLAAAGAAHRALDRGGRWMIDVAMAGVAAAVVGADAGRTWDAVPSNDAAQPRAEPPRATAHALGADTDAVFAELGLA